MKENEYILLLFKRLSGDISPAEASLLSEWISQSPENERIVTEYTLVWEKSGSYSRQFSPNLEADFANIQAKIHAEERPVLRVQTSNFKWMRAAAAVALLAVAIWGYKQLNTSAYYDAVASVEQVDKQLVTLSDGTQVWLRKGSSLQYAQSFAGKKERLVKLSGEAYFDVAHDPQHPFRVELASGAYVEVLGTQFDIQQSADATSVLVRSGRVKFSPNSSSQAPVLTANQKAVFNRKANTLQVTTAPTLNDLAWQTGNLEFVRTPLSQVVLDLEKYYNVKISLRNPAMNNCLHNALLHTGKPLKDVLDGLALTYQLKVQEISKGEYTLSGGQCQ